MIIKTWKKKARGKKAEKNERSLVITYLFSRSSLAITLFVTLCFPFPLHQKHSLYVHQLLKNSWKRWGWFFFKFLFLGFLSHTLQKTVHQLLKKFVKMLGLIFFSNSCFFQSLFLLFVTHCCFPFPLHQKHSLYAH